MGELKSKMETMQSKLNTFEQKINTINNRLSNTREVGGPSGGGAARAPTHPRGNDACLFPRVNRFSFCVMVDVRWNTF